MAELFWMWVKVVAITLATIALALVVLWGVAALANEYWSSCEEAYQFCDQRPYNRGCAVFTHWGQPLSVERMRRVGNTNTEAFCKNNQWHMACTRLGEEHYVELCPIPSRYKTIEGRMWWAWTEPNKCDDLSPAPCTPCSAGHVYNPRINKCGIK